MDSSDTIDNLILELRRGVIVLAVLSQLDEEQYGYSLIKHLSQNDLDIDQGTLYPLLRRLENQGLLDSTWRVESDHPRRYYVINAKGKRLLDELKTEWSRISSTLNRMLSKKSSDS